jgi:repressor LexA
LLEYIVKEVNEKGYQPTIRDMMKIINVKSLRGVTYHLDELQRKGYIIKERLSRGIAIQDRAFYELSLGSQTNKIENVSIPLIGRIAAGNPIVAYEEYSEKISISSEIAKNSFDYFGLWVEGDSMIEDHIQEGDIVIIKKQNYARNGQIIAAVVNDSTTLKRFYQKNGLFILQPANSKYEPIIIKDNLTINGVLVGLIRKYNFN